MPRRPVFLLLHLSCPPSFPFPPSHPPKKSPIKCLKWSWQTPYWDLSLTFKVWGESKHLGYIHASQIILQSTKEATCLRHWLPKKVCDWSSEQSNTLYLEAHYSGQCAVLQFRLLKRKGEVREHNTWQIAFLFPFAGQRNSSDQWVKHYCFSVEMSVRFSCSSLTFHSETCGEKPDSDAEGEDITNLAQSF